MEKIDFIRLEDKLWCAGLLDTPEQRVKVLVEMFNMGMDRAAEICFNKPFKNYEYEGTAATVLGDVAKEILYNKE